MPAVSIGDFMLVQASQPYGRLADLSTDGVAARERFDYWRDVVLRRHGRVDVQVVTVRLPQVMPLPDVITYQGRIFVPRTDGTYTEATVWPVIEELDCG